MKSTAIVSFLDFSSSPESLPEGEYFTPSEFVRFVLEEKLGAFQRFKEVLLVVSDLRRVKRRLLWVLLLKLTSVHSRFVTVDGETRRITWGTTLREMGYFVREVICGLSEYFFANRAISQLSREPLVTTRRFSVHQTDRPTVIYIRGGLPSGHGIGGSVTHAAGVVNSLVQSGYSVEFWCPNSNPLLDPRVVQEPIAVYGRFANLLDLENLRLNRVLLQRLSRHRYPGDVAFVYQRYGAYSYAGLGLAKKFRVPLVLEFNSSPLWTARNWGGTVMFRGLAARAEKALCEKATLVTVVSNALRKRLMDRGIPEEKILVNPNGVDAARFHPEIDDTDVRAEHGFSAQTLVGFVGTFGPWHGAPVLARAVAALAEHADHMGLHFLFIGDGRERSVTEQILWKHECLRYCTFTGIVPPNEVPAYLAACDILVAPHVPNPDGSRFFGSPTKLFEYMAMGRSIIASNLDQIGTILDHKKTALLVEPADVEALRSAIVVLAEDEHLRNALGTAARREVIRHYTWQQHTSRILRRLSDLCGTRR